MILYGFHKSPYFKYYLHSMLIIAMSQHFLNNYYIHLWLTNIITCLLAITSTMLLQSCKLHIQTSELNTVLVTIWIQSELNNLNFTAPCIGHLALKSELNTVYLYSDFVWLLIDPYNLHCDVLKVFMLVFIRIVHNWTSTDGPLRLHILKVFSVSSNHLV